MTGPELACSSLGSPSKEVAYSAHRFLERVAATGKQAVAPSWSDTFAGIASAFEVGTAAFTRTWTSGKRSSGHSCQWVAALELYQAFPS